MRFRPRLEDLDRRDLPDAAPIAPPIPAIAVPAPPAQGQPKPTREELNSLLEEYQNLLTTLECIRSELDQLKQQMNSAQSHYTRLLLNDDLLTAQFGTAAYEAMKEAARQEITDLFNRIDNYTRMYNNMLDRLNELRNTLAQGAIDGTIPLIDVMPVMPQLPPKLNYPTIPPWVNIA